MNKTIGFIGLGHMGSNMANNLLKKKDATDTLYVWNRTASKMDRFIAGGAIGASSPAELAEKCDYIFICLAGPHEVQKIVADEGGLIDHGHKGQFILDMSTVDREISIAVSKQAAEKGITYIDMPVSGGVYLAETGELSLMLAARKEEVEEPMPYIQMIGNKITYLGARGNGSAAKLIHNAVSLHPDRGR